MTERTKKNLKYFPHSVQVSPEAKGHHLLHDLDKTLVRVHLKHGLKIFVVTALLIAVGLPPAWGFAFKNRVRPGFLFHGHEVTYLTAAELKTKISQEKTNLVIEVPSQSASVQKRILLRGGDIETQFDAERSAKELLGASSKNPYKAFLEDIRRFNDPRPIPHYFTYNEGKFNEAVETLTQALNYPAQNARVVFKEGKFEVVPEVYGSSISEASVRAGLAEAFTYGKPTFEAPAAPVEPAIKRDAAKKAADEAMRFLSENFTLRFLGGKTASPDLSEKGNWIAFDEKGSEIVPRIDVERVRMYVEKIDKQFSDAYTGLEINGATNKVVAALADATSGTIALPEIEKRRRPPGRLGKYIEVDLSRQRVYLYENGQLYYQSGTVTGAPATPTVTGTFAIYTKNYSVWLVGAGYRLWSEYWMPFYDGYGLHDAPWRQEWQFSDPSRYRCCGSHGCVNLPKATARTIWNWAPVGTTVWVHY